MHIAFIESVLAQLKKILKERASDTSDQLLRRIEGQMVPTDLQKAYRDVAFANYHRDGEIEVDEDALISAGDDPGAYVMAWIWIYDDQLPQKMRPKR